MDRLRKTSRPSAPSLGLLVQQFAISFRKVWRILVEVEQLPNEDPAEALLRTYSADGGINYLDAAATLPSRPAIDAACVELLSLLFPGFHGEPVMINAAHASDSAQNAKREMQIVQVSENNLKPLIENFYAHP